MLHSWVLLLLLLLLGQHLYVQQVGAQRLPLLVRQPQFILDFYVCVCECVRVCVPACQASVPSKVGTQQNGAHKQKTLRLKAKPVEGLRQGGHLKQQGITGGG